MLAGDGDDGKAVTTITADAATGSQELVIRGYSKINGVLGIGRGLFSDAFAVGGHRWFIVCFPDGERPENADSIDVLLAVDPAIDGHVTARFEFSLLDQHGGAGFGAGFLKTFARADQGWGCTLLKKVQLESSPYLYDDSFRIRCDLKVITELQAGPVVVTPAASRRSGDQGSGTTISTETDTGSHLLVVEDYSKTKGLFGVGRWFYSGVFAVAGHYWGVLYFPDGCDQENSEFISIFLHMIDPRPPISRSNVKARYKFSLLDQAGEPLLPFTRVSEILTFRANNTHGYRRFIHRRELEYLSMSPYLKNDSFKIRCEVTVLKNRIATTVQLPPLPPSNLHHHLGDLLASQVGADIKFKVGRETFAAHRNVLAARSPVFMAALYGPMRERTVDHVRIDDMEPRVFKAFLHFIYTDLLPDVGEGEEVVMAQHLLVAADRYHMERLKTICERILCTRIETNTAATTLALAEQHDCRWLKEACLKFIASPRNLKVVMAGDGFQHLMTSCPSLLKELAAKIAA